MSQRPLAVVRILIVDDKELVRKLEVMRLRGITHSKRERYGIEDFEIDVAETAAEAKLLLLKAASRPYDLVLLDLKLPLHPGEALEVENGFALLQFIKESQTAKGVIVVSTYDIYENVVTSFRGGALDFLSKSIYKETFEPQVLNTLGRLFKDDSERILNQRVRDLVSYAEVGLAHSFKLIFNGLLDGVTEAAEGVERHIRERYELDRESHPNDALMLQLRNHERAVTRARRDWAGLQGELAGAGKVMQERNVGGTLRELKEALLPSLVVKNVALELPDSGGNSVLTFENDVEIVLREVVAGALSELPDYVEGRRAEDWWMRVSFATEDNHAVVRFEDNFDPLPAERVQAINEGRRILPDAGFGRAWGLSVAQHVALRGGGELIVKTERAGNVVSYHVPLADNA